MKLSKLLTIMYKQNPEERDIENSLNYAYRHLTYLNEGNPLLKSNEVLHLGEYRHNNLTGEEIVEKGFYTLWTGAHDGIEWLQRHSCFNEALKTQNKWNEIQFSPCDFCAILEVR